MQISKAMKYIALQISDAVSRWEGWALAYPEFGNSVTNPIPTRGGQVMPTTLLLTHPDFRT